jgi:hypothetical protein
MDKKSEKKEEERTRSGRTKVRDQEEEDGVKVVSEEEEMDGKNTENQEEVGNEKGTTGTSKVKVRKRAGWTEVLPEQAPLGNSLESLGLGEMNLSVEEIERILDWETGTQ